MEKLNVELGAVQETLLIPLLGRAKETEKKGGLINDPKAVEIVNSLNYDFDKWKKSSSLTGATIRTRLYDEIVQDFLQQNPEGTIIEIGCGLNTRYERLDNGFAQWIELDLPDTITLRKKFFNESPRRTIIAASVLETHWMDKIAAEMAPPFCLISEAAIIYLKEEQVKSLVQELRKRFKDALFITDTTDSKMVKNQHKHDAMKKLPQSSWFKWECDDPANLSAWGLKLLSSKTFMDTSAELRRKFPFVFRFLIKYAPWLVRKMIKGYNINIFRIT